MADISLKKNWDKTLNIDDIHSDIKLSSNFIKSQEYLKILDFVENKSCGSLLLSGERGSGKTTNITRVLEELKDQVFPVYINALHLESVNEQEEDSFLATMHILKQIIRSFAFSLDRRFIKKTKNLNALLKLIYFNDVTVSNYSKTTGSVGANSDVGFPKSGGLVGNLIGIKSSFDVGFTDEEVFKKVGYTIDDYSEDFKQCLKEYEKYGFNELCRLKIFKREFPLKFFTKKHNKKIVFVVDELDFYDNSNSKTGSIGPKEVLQSIKRLKNLFNLSEAHFIFIAGVETYKLSLNPGNKNEFNTLFSDRIFLTKPFGEEFVKCLDRYFTTNQNKPKQELFKWFLVQNSRHNYYKLIQEVKARVFGDINKKKLIVNTSLSRTEEALAIMHYAMNSIYKHFINLGIFQHNSEVLFDELSVIEKNYDDWIHGQGLHPVNIDVNPERASGLKPEVKGQIQTAKRGFISYVFKLNNNEVPPDVENKDTKETTIPWDTLRTGLTFSAVKKGITGPVIPTETEFIDLSHKLVNKLNELLFSKKSVDLEGLLKRFSDELLLQIANSDISLIVKGVKSVGEGLIFNRNLKEVEVAFETLKRVFETIESRLVVFKNKLVIQKDFGNISIENKEIVFNGKARCLTLFQNLNFEGDFEIKSRVKLMANSLINFLLYKKYNNSPTEDEYYMLRLDSRIATDSIGDGVLYKGLGTEVWQHIDGIEKRSSSRSGVWCNIKISRHGNDIIFYKKKNNRKSRYQKIAKIVVSGEISQLGIFSEKGQIEMKEISVK